MINFILSDSQFGSKTKSLGMKEAVTQVTDFILKICFRVFC